jgi:hypothetical protein
MLVVHTLLGMMGSHAADYTVALGKQQRSSTVHNSACKSLWKSDLVSDIASGIEEAHTWVCTLRRTLLFHISMCTLVYTHCQHCHSRLECCNALLAIWPWCEPTH